MSHPVITIEPDNLVEDNVFISYDERYAEYKMRLKNVNYRFDCIESVLIFLKNWYKYCKVCVVKVGTEEGDDSLLHDKSNEEVLKEDFLKVVEDALILIDHTTIEL